MSVFIWTYFYCKLLKKIVEEKTYALTDVRIDWLTDVNQRNRLYKKHVGKFSNFKKYFVMAKLTILIKTNNSPCGLV